MLDKPCAYSRTHGETEVEYSSEPAEDLCTGARGSAVAEVGRGSGLESRPATKEAFDDGCKEKEVGPIFGQRG